MSLAQKLVLRRAFLKGLGLAAGGLAIGASGARRLIAGSAERSSASGFKPSAFLYLDPNGQVTVVCHKSEMGQGVRSSLPVLVTDELGAELSSVNILQADLDPAFGTLATGGSTSIRDNYIPLRTCGATARVMLIAVAAKRWQVPAGECDTLAGEVLHAPSQRRFAFADLVAEAATLPAPDPSTVTLRSKSQLRYIGKERLPVTDAPNIVRGRAVYGADVTRPGMVVAVIARPPVVGARVATVDASQALKIPGVLQVLTLPSAVHPYAFSPLGGVAVVARDTWAAICGRDALAITWDQGPNAAYDSSRGRDELLRTVRSQGQTVRELGNVDAALQAAAKQIQAEYFVPHLAQMPMEPPCALAEASANGCEIWLCTQAPEDTATQVAATLGIAASAVKVHVTLLGGGFGRKAQPDYAAEAAWLSRAVGAPVRVQWTRTDDIQHSYYHAISAQSFTAGLDAGGKLTAFLHRTAFPSLYSTFQDGIAQAQLDELNFGAIDLPLATANFRTEVGQAAPAVRIGWMRSVASIHHGFAVNSFLDEIAHARNLDPKDSLLDLLGPARQLTSPAPLGLAALPNYGMPLSQYPIDVGRYRAVIDHVTRLANWDDRQRDGRALGLAAHASFLSYIGVVIAVSYDKDQKIRVDEAWVAADLGTVVNPDRVKAQLAGSVIFAMSLALHGSISIRNGAVEQTNFHDYPVVRIGEAPRRIHTEVLASDALPGGAGEPGVPPAVAALGNAIFALTGTRVRELPIRDLKIPSARERA